MIKNFPKASLGVFCVIYDIFVPQLKKPMGLPRRADHAKTT
jgi:hypothetical protein